MSEETFDIQKLVQESGIPRRTIYFYVQQGILPPPEGAGLAAYYTREHLLRLQLIPVLRARGLRLDDIRQRLGEMSLDEMARLLAEEPSNLRPLLSPVPPVRGEPVLPQAPLKGRPMLLYNLPGGVTLIAPAGQTADGDSRLRRLLEAAAQIYDAPGVLTPENGKIRLDRDDPSEEK